MVRKRDSDGKYEITPQGKEEAEWPSRILQTGPRSIEGTLDELSSYVSYLEDLSHSKDAKMRQNAEKIKELAERLSKVAESK